MGAEHRAHPRSRPWANEVLVWGEGAHFIFSVSGIAIVIITGRVSRYIEGKNGIVTEMVKCILSEQRSRGGGRRPPPAAQGSQLGKTCRIAQQLERGVGQSF